MGYEHIGGAAGDLAGGGGGGGGEGDLRGGRATVSESRPVHGGVPRRSSRAAETRGGNRRRESNRSEAVPGPPAFAGPMAEALRPQVGPLR